MIHQYKNNGFNMVLDVNSGSVHVVDDVVYDMLELMDRQISPEDISEALKGKYAPEEIGEACAEVRELTDEGMTILRTDLPWLRLCACISPMTAIWHAGIVLRRKANIMAEEP